MISSVKCHGMVCDEEQSLRCLLTLVLKGAQKENRYKFNTRKSQTKTCKVTKFICLFYFLISVSQEYKIVSFII